MDRSLLRGLPVLFCCFRVLSGSFLDREYADSVQCTMCHIKFPGQKCTKGRGICFATTEEACTVGTIVKSDGTPWLTFMGCLKNCANVNNIKWSIYFVNFQCCRSHHFCNEQI
uniref:Prostate and testis expressed 1 n=1 Tax=Pipistrellus kuhlii TaxID=59472 RepID=A0A7J7UGR1_PIPKU|nr:prostate and testis expressed 1 [Pipistrellus kuhlii]